MKETRDARELEHPSADPSGDSGGGHTEQEQGRPCPAPSGGRKRRRDSSGTTSSGRRQIGMSSSTEIAYFWYISIMNFETEIEDMAMNFAYIIN